MKYCHYCEKPKPTFKKAKSIYYYDTCIDCIELEKEKQKQYLIKTAINYVTREGFTCENDNEYLKLYQKMKRIKKKYNLTYKIYLKMVDKSNGLCEICKTESFKVIDHCHTTGKVRGLLCVRCNYGIGYFKDNKQSLSNAIEYLNKDS